MVCLKSIVIKKAGGVDFILKKRGGQIVWLVTVWQLAGESDPRWPPQLERIEAVTSHAGLP